MSHFSVAVFSHHPGEVEELLAPYNEQTEDEEYLEFEEASESMEDIRARAVDRRYLALVHGVIPHDTGMVDAPIARAASCAKASARFAPSVHRSKKLMLCPFGIIRLFALIL